MVKNPPAKAGDVGLISRSGRSSGAGHGHPLQYPCLENPMDRGAWLGYSPWGHKESDMAERRNSNILTCNGASCLQLTLSGSEK